MTLDSNIKASREGSKWISDRARLSLTHPDPDQDEALALLIKVGKQVEPLMKQHAWKVTLQGYLAHKK